MSKNRYSKQDYLDMVDEILDLIGYDSSLLSEAVEDYASCSDMTHEEVNTLYDYAQRQCY